MTAKLYLVDGMSHIYRAYHAIPPLNNSKGIPTNAAYGFTNMLRKLIKEETPDYLGVAMDLAAPTVRHEKYQEYKATRRPMPDDLLEQIPYILRVCEVLRVPVLSWERYEADDVIGTLAIKAVEKDLDVVIVTIDKDMFQLVNQRVTVLDTRTMKRFDHQKVEEKFGVPPEKIVDVLSLVGDTSDNIPGAPGIGEKGASQLIRQYGSLENLLAHRDEVPRKTYRESLQQNEAQILQSRELVSIHCDLPVALDLEELKLCGPDERAARELFAELEFTTLLEEFLPSRDTTEARYQKIESPEALKDLAARIEGKNAGLALLPSGRYLEDPLQAIAVAADMHEVWYIPQEFLQGPDIQKMWRAAGRWLVHDLKPLYFFAQRHGWPYPENVLDTMLMAYLSNPSQSDFSLEHVSIECLRYRLQGVSEERGLLGEESVAALCERAGVTLQLADTLLPELEEKKLLELLNEIEMPLVQVLARMEETGVKVDCEILHQMSREVEGEIENLRSRICDLAGGEFNINSPRQLAAVLFDNLNLPLAKKTRKSGHYATGVEVLEELAATYDIARFILDYRELTKLKGTYLDALPKLVNPRTGRIHTSYNQMVTATGRLSSSNPNLQNIPIKSELGRKIRRAFVAEPGFQILAADYSQLELRIMAHLSRDPVLVESFRKGEDIHERTAREVFGMSAVMNPQEFRRHAKVINFGIMYGLSAFGLAQSLKIDRKEAQLFIDNYFQKYQGVKKWIDQTLAEVYEKGYVRTLFGRIRQIPEVRSSNRNQRNFGERTAINAPIQGTGADLIKKAMLTMDREILERGLKSRLIMQVHDELVLEVEESEAGEMKELVRQHMEGAAQLSVPLKVDLAIGQSWYDAK